MINKDKVKKDFAFKLTDKEKLSLGLKAANLSVEISVIDADFDKVKDKYKGILAEKESQKEHALSLIKKGEEIRNVECEEIKDYKKESVKYIYNGKTLLSRGMTDEEKQLKMKLDKKTKKNKKATLHVLPNKDIASHMRNETSVLNA